MISKKQNNIGLHISNRQMNDKKHKTKHIDYKEWLMQELQDHKLALAYLNEALADDDQKVFLIALKDVLEAQEVIWQR